MSQIKAMQLALDALLSHVSAYPYMDKGYMVDAREALRGALAENAMQQHADAYQGMEQPTCNPHPLAPHGFNRNSSHSLGRYMCECEGWESEPTGERAERKRVGDSKFESWYSELSQASKGSKQIAREAYEAGMNFDMLEADAQPKTCTWTLDDDESGTWASACGELWNFIEGGPDENRVSYCHHCGGKVVKGPSL
jgi:hypothetical protein